MAVGNTLCKESKSPSSLWAWSIKNLDYYLIGRYQRKILKDEKVLPCEACTTRHKSLLCDSKWSGEKDSKNVHEDCAKSDFTPYIKKYRASSQKDTSVEGC